MNLGKKKLKHSDTLVPGEHEFYKRLQSRHQWGRIGKAFNMFSIGIAILALIVLFGNVANEAFGTVGIVNTIEPDTLSNGRPLEDLTNQELAMILADNVTGRLRVLIRDSISQVSEAEFTSATVADIVGDPNVDPTIADQILKDLDPEQQANLLATYASTSILRNLVLVEVVEQQIIASYSLSDTIFNFDAIKAEIEGAIFEDYKTKSDNPDAKVEVIRFYSWIDSDFISTPMSSTPALAGIRTALVGSIGLMIIVVLVSLPVGVGAAIYLEEYASDSFINRLIETTVRNLAGVPSIIYGMLGLAIFVRALAPFTSGMLFHYKFDVPTVETVMSRIAPVFNDELVFADDQITSQSALIDVETTQKVVDTFLYYGTPSLNMMGNANIYELSNSLADALKITVDVVPVRGEEEFDIEIRGSRYRFDIAENSPIPDDTYDALINSLVRINSFTPNGRTIISAGLTLVLLILPVIIINAQEAIRAVPYAIREASYGLGATKWQTIWNQVLPAAMPGIMTGTILAVSRAVGETAPLIVVGAATYLVTDPTSPFSQFTAMPIQIYQWTARPQGQFADIAAAAIIVLLVLMLTLNAVAIFLRNRYSIRY